MDGARRATRRAVALLGALVIGLSTLVTPPAAAATLTPYLVQVAPGLDVTAVLEPTVAALGGRIERVHADAIHGAVVRLPAGAPARLLAVPGIASVERDQPVRATQTNPPWGLDRIDQRALPLSRTYSYRSTGVGVDAYVIDSGMRFSHQQLAGRSASGIDVVDGGRADDCNGHGTHVAGTLGGSTYGVAKAVRLIAVRVLDCQGAGTDSSVIAGIAWVIRHHTTRPAVANLSLGGPPSAALDTAVNNLIRDGVTVVVAAGNDGGNACSYSPGRVGGALTVAASDRNDALASYSNRGTCIDLIAPGSAIVSATRTSDTATATMSGTSMASPHVAGAAARYLQGHPTAKPASVAAALTASASTGRISGTGQSCALLILACVPATANRLLYVAPTG